MVLNGEVLNGEVLNGEVLSLVSPRVLQAP